LFALITVTVYVVVAAGLMVIAAVVAPVLHTYDVPPEAVSVTEAPAHIIPSLLATPEVSDIPIAGVGNGLTVIIWEALWLQLFALVTVTE
jgi:hypothetical protein